MENTTKKKVMASPSEYRKYLRIPAGGEFRRLDEVLDPWQRADFEALDPGWARVAGIEGVGQEAKTRAYLERGRGHSKTSDIGVMVSWALFASRTKISGHVVAVDREQGRILRSVVGDIVSANSWLREYLTVERDRIRNPHTGSECVVLSSDAMSAYGTTPHFVICDELTHWPESGKETWTAIFSASAKRNDCMLVVISNAGTGMGKSWQWKIREAARQSESWIFSRLDGPRASWIQARRLAEQREILPPSAYARLWLNQWTAASGDALDPEDVAAAVTLPGPQSAEPETVYLSGLDLGIKHDHAAHVVVGVVPGSGRVKVCRVDSWRPVGGRVDLEAVEKGVRDAHEKFGLDWIGYDVHQAAYMAQRLEADGFPVEEVPFVVSNLSEMAVALLQAFRGRKIDLYDDHLLLQDLGKLSITERNFTYKLTAPSDETGHCDRATALAITLPVALKLANADASELCSEDPDEYATWRVVLD